MRPLVRVQNFSVSSDGYGAGEGQSHERPFGHADPAEFMSWAGATAHWVNRTDPGGSFGLDDYITRDWAYNIGAEIMGRNKFGPQRGPWENYDWQGWWGDEPPFRTPVFVLTHHARPSFTLGDTTFHFLDASPRTHWRGRWLPLRAKTCASAAALRRFGSSSTPISSTRCTSRSHRSSSAAGKDCGRAPKS